MLDAKTAEVLGKLRWFGRAAFLIEDRFKIYVDPYRMPNGLPEADIILITRNQPEHCSVPDATKVSKIQSIVVGPADCACRFRLNQLALKAGETKSVLGVPVTGTPSGEGIGFVWEIGGVKIYHAGGFEGIPEAAGVEADIALLPVSLEPREAAALARRVKARAVLPMGFDPAAPARAEAFVAAARAVGLESFVPQPSALSPR